MPFKILKLKVAIMLFVFHPNVPRFVGNKLCIQVDRPRHVIVYIPTAAQGKVYEKRRPRQAT